MPERILAGRGFIQGFNKNRMFLKETDYSSVWARLTRMVLSLLGMVAVFCPVSAFAVGELREIYRHPRALAMGNAFTAIADDEAAMFYNPAGLAGITKTTIQFAALDLELSSESLTVGLEGTSQVKKLDLTTVNLLMGKNIYLRGSAIASYSIPNFGLAVIADEQIALYAKNPAYPQVVLGLQTTNGLQMSYGTTVNRLNRERYEIRVGGGVKYLFRRGGYHLLTLEQMVNLNTSTVSNVTGNYETSLGLDLGVQYVKHINKRLSLVAGLAYTEIGGLKFGGQADAQPENLSFGLAAKLKFPGLAVNVAYDYRHITQSTDARMRHHMGVEFKLPIFSLYGGYNQVYPSYGFGVNVWLVNVMLLSYIEEIGSLAHQDPERRYLLRAAVGFGL